MVKIKGVTIAIAKINETIDLSIAGTIFAVTKEILA